MLSFVESKEPGARLPRLSRHAVRKRTKSVRAAVFARAKGKCEACCRPLGESGHLDHFWGRAKAPTNVETCWALCLRCDYEKTNNRPSAINWLRRYWVHCRRYVYPEQCERAEARAEVLKAKGLVCQ